MKATDSDESGGFVFRRLPAGKYKLVLEQDPHDEKVDVSRDISLAGGEKVEIELVFRPKKDGTQ